MITIISTIIIIIIIIIIICRWTQLTPTPW